MGSGTTTGNIILTNTEGASNTLPFTVRAGNIYFVDASTPVAGDGSYGNMWQSPASYYTTITGSTGNTCYFKAGTYNGEYGRAGWHGNMVLASDQAGASGAENAFIGYPGETAVFEADAGDLHTCFDSNGTSAYVVVANLRCIASGGAIGSDNYWRVVGNKVTGISSLSATGVITSANDGVKILGNDIYGGTSNSKYDHAFYPH